MIAVVDYKKGNLLSVERGLRAVGADARITDDAAEIAAADAIVLPGVGAFADAAATMDEALIMAAVDISGRGQLYWDADVPAVMVGSFDATLAKEFFIAFAANAGVTLHIRQLAGENTHHVIEGMFKAVARAMRQACEPDPRMGDALPSTKGML